MPRPINKERDILIYNLKKKEGKSFREISAILSINERAVFDGYYREAAKKGEKIPKSARVDLSTE